MFYQDVAYFTFPSLKPCFSQLYDHKKVPLPYFPCLSLWLFSYFCRQGATSSTPSQGDDADECPAGHYCPQQTSEPQKCPLGSYSSATRLTDMSQCLNCTAGEALLNLTITIQTRFRLIFLFIQNVNF